MGNFLKTQNAFSNGEISTEFYATDNSTGVSKLENMDVLQSGAIKRRPGLKSIATVANSTILIPFQISDTERYLLVVYDTTIDVYQNDEKVATVVSPWGATDLSKLQYAQRFNTIFFVHPDYQPKVFTKTASGFSISSFVFYTNADATVNVPFIRFEDSKGITITITSNINGANYATFTTSADFWTNDCIGERLYVNDKQWLVTAVTDAREATVYTSGNFTLPADPISDWYEAAFSNRRGWPSCVSFHQNRLVFAATPEIPNGVWLSKVGEHTNFDAGTGLDDESIYTALLSDAHQQICTIVSSDKMQILTSGGEWAISNSPLTPSSIDIKQHTNIGSLTTRYLPPQKIEGRTIFISENGTDVRELDLDALGENYSATDLSLYAKHLINNPISIAYDKSAHKLFVVMDDGYMAVLNKYSNTDISAWGKYTTDGKFKYVCVFDNNIYVVVQRKNNCYLEKFDDSCLKDANDYGFSYCVSALPMIVSGHNPKKIRVRKVSVRLQNTKTVFVNGYRMEIPNNAYDENSDGFSGDLSINLLGTENDTTKPLWTLSSSEQLPATILSVTADGNYII